MASVIDDPILKRFRAALDQLYGARIERVVLFGSRARGDATGDSDYDILYDEEAFIHAMPYRAYSYEERTPLMREIRRDGVDL
jgi:uncharacterized protein